MAKNLKIDGEFPELPLDPVDALVNPLKRFLHIESASGILLILTTLSALIIANSPFSANYVAFWKTPFELRIGPLGMEHSLQHWINDGLMTIFFFVIGLEVKRELILGELRDLKQAALPIAAAIGGMVVPAAIYILLQHGAPGERGWGIPMATDIAFVVGCLTVLGSRIPGSLRVLLLSLAIADDIGAILVIAVGYTDHIGLTALAFGILGIGVIFGFMKIGIRNLAVYIILMILVWIAFHESGIHATIAGVIFGMITPAKAWISEGRLMKMYQKSSQFLQGEGWRNSGERYEVLRRMEKASRTTISPLERFEKELHPWVGFVIMPIFSLANSGVAISFSDFTSPVAIAVMLGLFVGKPVGIFLFIWLAIRFGVAKLPQGIGWGVITGGGLLAGIGFTMSIFIAGLALEGPLLDAAKVGILAGSILSAVAGITILILLLPKPSS